jgi:hypothetical protein
MPYTATTDATGQSAARNVASFRRQGTWLYTAQPTRTPARGNS